MRDASSERTGIDAAGNEPTDPLGQMLCADQRLRWLQGQCIPVEGYFEHYPDLRTNEAVLKELVAGEIRLRRELQEPVDFSSFCKRFPDLIVWLRQWFERQIESTPSCSTEVDGSDSHDVDCWPDVPGFDILGLIGRGGVGRVFKARQRKLNRVVALKMLLAGVHAGTQAVARFRSEAAAVARLQHPYIVQIFDIIEHHEQIFLALEYVGGGNLAKYIAGKPQPVQQTVEMLRTLAQAVQFAHDQGIVHRDLKPANILLTEVGIPKVTDFGLAKRLDDDHGLTKTGAVLGTPDYMAPEQAEGRTRDIGPATDIYGLGAILYEMLVGAPPFRGEALVHILDAVRFQTPPPPRTLRPDLPRDLETICLHCLAKIPAHRYASAQQLADDLQRFLDGKSIQAHPGGIWQRISGWFGV